MYNIYSLDALGDILGSADCFICEADLYVSDGRIFDEVDATSCSYYMGKMVHGYSEDWIFEMHDKRITRIKKGGLNSYNMVGISFWTKEDGKQIREAIRGAYQTPGHEQLFWDEIVDKELEQLNVTVLEVPAESVIEVDTMEELRRLEDFVR